jgi:hypothetical protein
MSTMIHFRYLYNQLEIAFWMITIRLMKESNGLQNLLLQGYHFQHFAIKKQGLLRLAVMVGMGWLAGFMIGVASILLVGE